MTEKDLQLVVRTEENSVAQNPEEARFQVLHEQVMSEEAYRYYVLGQITAYVDIIKQDLNSVIEKVDNLRDDLRQIRESSDDSNQDS